MAPPPNDPEADRGRVIDGKYELTDLAGQGGMATVWKAQMRGAAGFARTAAVKKMRPEFPGAQHLIALLIAEGGGAVSLTAPGTVKGKMSYLSPEIAFGHESSPLTDIFSMGSVLWEALAGRTLFDGKTDIEVFKKIRSATVEPLEEERPDIPPEL